MPRQNVSSRLNDKSDEHIEISFLGFRFKCSKPGWMTVIILLIILAFLLCVIWRIRPIFYEVKHLGKSE